MADAVQPSPSVEEAHARDAEIVRLQKMVDALIKRAEQNTKSEASEYKLFEAAVVLEGEVQRRTRDLEEALHENERINRAMQYRDAILHAITRSAAELVSGSALRDATPRILKTVGEAIGADRILVLESARSGPRVALRHVWHGLPDIPQVTPDVVAAMAMQESAEFDAGQSRLRAGETVATPRPLAAGAVKSLFEALGIRSRLQLPIFVDGEFWGQIAIDDCQEERSWTAAEIDTLRVLADLVGASIARDRYTVKLSAADAVVSSSPAILYRLQGDTAPLPLVYVSENVLRLGYSPAELLADPRLYDSLVHPDDRAALKRVQAAAAKGGGAGSVEFRLRAAHGGWRWFENRFTLTRQGRKTENKGILLDVTERRAAEEALRQMLERTQRQLEVTGIVSRTEALVTGDVEAAAREITELAAKATGCERVNAWVFNEDESELHCIDLFEATPARHSAGMVLRECDYRDEFHAMKTAKYVNADDPLTDPRTAGYVETYLKPLGITSMLDAVIHASGRNYGLLCFEHVGKRHRWTQDEIAFACQLADKIGFTMVNRNRREAENKIKASQAALAEAQAVAHVGSWEIDLQTGPLLWSDETHRIFGVDPASFRPSYEALLARVHPDDRAAFDKDYRGSLAGGRAHDIEYRVLIDDGSVKWVHARGATVFAADGAAVRSIGTVQDITGRKLAELALAESQQIIQGVFDSVPVRLFWKDKNLVFLGCNAAFARDAGLADPKDIVGKDDYQMGWRDQAEAYRADDREVIESGRAKLFIEEAQTTPDGKSITLLTSKLPLRRQNGEIYGVLGTYTDITGRKIAEEQLRRERDFSAALIESVPGIFFVLDAKGNNLRFNANLANVTGRTREELQGLNALTYVAPESRETVVRRMRELIGGSPPSGREIGLVHRSGEVHQYHIVARPIQLENGPGVVGMGVDVTEKLLTERLLRESEEKFRTVFSSVTEGIFLVDPATDTYVEFNQSGCEMFGYSREEIIGQKLGTLSSGEAPYNQAEAMALVEKARSEGPQTFEWHCKAKDGRRFWTEISVRYTSFGAKDLVLATVRDITAQKAAAAQILQMARFDALTGLANRRVFAEAVEQAIARAQRGGKGFAVLYLDLDHFKDVNDTLGHPVGDLLLKSVAERLKACVRATDTVARFGGDEFAVLAVDINEPMDAGTLGEKILAVMGKPVTIGGNEIRCGTSVGVAVFGPDSAEAESLLTHADVALYRAKSEGRGTYRFFTDAMDEDVRRRVKMDRDLRKALDEEEFFLVYQPQVEAASGRIVGMEALVRWRHPERGIVSPAEFIPAAEKNGLIVPLGRWVLREACRQTKAWRDGGIPPVVMGVNLSALQFKTPRELEQSIADALADNDMPANLLELELTESVLMKASHEHSDVLLRLRQRGLRLAIDDFGTGFSSLDYLRRFPVDRIKIAQVFIIDLVTAAGDAAIVKAAIGLARELGINIIAEGVETAAQLHLLQSWGCREVQGYFFAKPLTADEIAPLLRAGTARTEIAATAATAA